MIVVRGSKQSGVSPIDTGPQSASDSGGYGGSRGRWSCTGNAAF